MVLIMLLALYGENMEIVDVGTFFDKVIVERELPDDDCEYEVTLAAMDSYVKYGSYESWEPFLHGNSIANYLRNKSQGIRMNIGGVEIIEEHVC